MHFLGNVEITCEECGGSRFNDETLEIKYKSKNIYDILEMQVDEACEFFKGHPIINRYLDTLAGLGLGYITLGQSSTTLSGGEAQRIKLAAELSRPATGKTLYILDEPTTGLHSADIKVLLESINRLIDKGNTVITVEHHPDFIKTADRIIDLGPESGSRGGELVAAGTPEEVAGCKESYTGVFLGQLLADFPPQTYKTERKISQINEPIRLKGVGTHNLKNIDVEIPLNKLTVITGVSGSGKSSLAFDTIFAEGQRRFLSSFSTYARRLLANIPQADMEDCSGLTPTIAVSRKNADGNPRSTVGTMTEIYDYYRLLYARVGEAHCPDCGSKMNAVSCSRCGFKGAKTLFSRMFSFNHHQGACTQCKGLGFRSVCDPQKLVTHPKRSLLSGAMDGSKTGKFYGDPHGRYAAILETVGQCRGMDFSCSWQELPEEARNIAMFGSGEKRYAVTWKYKRKNRVGEHRFESDWQGFVNYINEEYERKHADKRGASMLPLLKDETCPHCRGDRLKPEFLSVYFAGISIAGLCRKTVKESIDFFARLIPLLSERALKISEELRREIVRRLLFLQDMGLDYLTLERSAATLSGGEAQRIRLSAQLGSGLTGVTYVLDEPTIGLHSRDTQRLLALLRKLRDTGNTLIVVEHDEDVIRSADFIIDLGPGPGKEGGKIVAQGSAAEIAKNPASKTGSYLQNRHIIEVPQKRRTLKEGIKIKGARANNLTGFDIEIPAAGIIALTGVSGSGKSSLLFDVLAASAGSGRAVGCESITGLEQFTTIVTMSRRGIGSSSLSTPATYIGLFDKIRELFARGELARERDYKKNRFSFNVKGGRCEFCRGTGEIRTSMDFLADVSAPCEECKGKRYGKETLDCTYRSKNIAEVLELTAAEALDFFTGHKGICLILEGMISVGLGYLQLGQPADTLSSGEAQRLKLVSELLKGGKDRNLYLFDEPTTGLHFEDVGRLLVLFNRLVEAGHTIVVIEHHPDVIKSADRVIDLGPEGGDRGGRIVGNGTPEQAARIPGSPTGRLLTRFFPQAVE
jgi:excinuclease ABC subunit A